MRRSAMLASSACAALMTCSVAPAQAAVVHPFDRAFGPDGTSSTAFGRPAALAVDWSTDVVFLADLSANKVLRFDSADQPAGFSALGSNEIGGFSFNSEGGVSQIAVNSTSGVFYVVDNFANKVKAFKASGEPAEFSPLAPANSAASANSVGSPSIKTAISTPAITSRVRSRSTTRVANRRVPEYGRTMQRRRRFPWRCLRQRLAWLGRQVHPVRVPGHRNDDLRLRRRHRQQQRLGVAVDPGNRRRLRRREDGASPATTKRGP